MFLDTEVVVHVTTRRAGQDRSKDPLPATGEELLHTPALHEPHGADRPPVQHSLKVEALLVEDMVPLELMEGAKVNQERTEKIKD